MIVERLKFKLDLKSANLWLIVWGLALFCLVCYRAINLSVVHDEAITFLAHILENSYTQILAFRGAMLANNHYFTEVVIKFWTDLWGVSALSLRLVSVLALPIYLWSVSYLLKPFTKSWYRLAAFIALTANPFLLDLFSLARGYAPAMAWSMAGLACLFNLILTNPKPKQKLWLISGASGLSAIAVGFNFSFIYFYLGITGVLAGWLLFKSGSDARFITRIKKLLINFLLLLPSLALMSKLLPLMFYLNKTGQIVVVGSSGIWVNTVLSLIGYSTGFTSQRFAELFVLAILAIAVYRIAVLAANKWKSDFPPETKAVILTFILLLILIVQIKLQYFINHVGYPVDRAALYFIPLFLILLISLGAEAILIAKAYRRQIGIFFCIGLIGLSLAQISGLKLNRTFIWPYDAHTRQAVTVITDLIKQSGIRDKEWQIANNWLFEPSMNFYLFQTGEPNINFVDREGPQKPADFYYLLPEDEYLLKLYNLRVIKRFENPTAILATSQR